MGFKENQEKWGLSSEKSTQIRSGSMLDTAGSGKKKTTASEREDRFFALEAQLQATIDQSHSRAAATQAVEQLPLRVVEQWTDYVSADEGEVNPYPLPKGFNETALDNDPLEDDRPRAQIHAGYVTVFNDKWNKLFGSSIKLVSPADYERLTETGIFRHPINMVADPLDTRGGPRRAKVRLRTVTSLFPSRDSAQRFEKHLMFAMSQGQHHVEQVMMGIGQRTFLARIQVTPQSSNRPLQMDAIWEVTDLTEEIKPQPIRPPQIAPQRSATPTASKPAAEAKQKMTPPAPAAPIAPFQAPVAKVAPAPTLPPAEKRSRVSSTTDGDGKPMYLGEISVRQADHTPVQPPVPVAPQALAAAEDDGEIEFDFEFSCEELTNLEVSDPSIAPEAEPELNLELKPSPFDLALPSDDVPVLTQAVTEAPSEAIADAEPPVKSAPPIAAETLLNPPSRFAPSRIDESLWDKLVALSAKGTAAASLDYLRLSVDAFSLSSASFWRLSADQSFFEREFMVVPGQENLTRVAVNTAADLADNAFPNTPAYYDALQNNHVVTTNFLNTPQMSLPLSDDDPNLVTSMVRKHSPGTPVTPVYSQQVDVPVLEKNKVIGMLRFITGAQGLACEGETLRFIRQCSLHASERILMRSLKSANEQLTQLAYFDDITGLGNERWFGTELNQLLDQQEPVSADTVVQKIYVCLAEIDQFKDICDQFGQKVGNHILKTTGQIIKAYIESHHLAQLALIARIHTDQFAFVIRASSVTQAQQVIHALLQNLGVRSPTPDFYQRVTACVGFTTFPEHGHQSDTLLQRAEFALYQAKQNGRSTIHSFTPDLEKRAQRRTAINHDLFKALDHNQLMVFYQPQVELDTNRVIGLEALIRWQHPVFGLVLPGAFLELAEEHELIERISEYVLQTTCDSAAKWRDAGLYDGPVSVNISGKHFRNKQLPSIITSALLKSHLSASRLTIEITETSVVDDRPETQQVLRALASLGVNLAIDDFGVGYSSLNYLKRLSVEHIKIDKSFIEGLPSDEDNLAIVTAIMTMAKRFKLNVIAEGVENEEQAECLKALGCYAAQGFYYSPPISIDELETLFVRGANPPYDI